MELKTVLELVKAGFTKDEIVQMDSQTSPASNPDPVQIAMDIPAQEAQPVSAPTQAVEPVAVAVPQPVPQPVPAPQPAPQPVQNPVENQPTMQDIMQSIAKLTSAVQANAIAQSVIPAGLTNPPSAEDMIAEIIRPTYKERG